jgi:hypothetical protein
MEKTVRYFCKIADFRAVQEGEKMQKIVVGLVKLLISENGSSLLTILRGNAAGTGSLNPNLPGLGPNRPL